MTDGFEAMVDAAGAFFPKLAANNSKDWFQQHKDFYKSDIERPATLFADLVAEDLGRMTGHVFKPKVFRIYRDVRFSKDKTPLNAHLHISWGAPEPDRPGWFWGLSPDYFILGMGLMGLKGPTLTAFRALIDARGAALEAAMAEADQASLSDYGPAPLKHVPKPYADDHPHAELLKRKAFAVHVPVPPDWRAQGLVKATCDAATHMMPIYNILSDKS